MRGPGKQLIRVVQESALPALLLRVPDEEILAASAEAGRLLGMPAEQLVGRNAEEFTADAPGNALGLVQSGRVSGFQSERRLRLADGDSELLQVWVRAAELVAPVSSAVVVLWPAGNLAWSYLPEVTDRGGELAVVVGTVDGHLQIERISDDVRVLGFEPQEALGMSVFRLFDISSGADVLHALADSADTRRGLCVTVNLVVDGEAVAGELMIRPLNPVPSFSFSLTIGVDPVVPGSATSESALQQMGRGLHALALAEATATLDELEVPRLANLSTRELEIVARLVSGDRVPAIAKALFLSQSTVRNHLSNAFRKMHVGSQQELIELIRQSADRRRG